MVARVLDGVATASAIKEELKVRIAALRERDTVFVFLANVVGFLQEVVQRAGEHLLVGIEIDRLLELLPFDGQAYRTFGRT